MASLILASGLCLTTASCLVTERRNAPISVPPAVTTSPEQAWTIQDSEGQPLGFLVHFEESTANATPRGFFSVRNPYQQELGLVDDLGRSWLFEPHAKSPKWLGSGTVAEATGRILGCEISLTKTSLDRLVLASAPKN